MDRVTIVKEDKQIVYPITSKVKYVEMDRNKEQVIIAFYEGPIEVINNVLEVAYERE